MTAPCAHSTPVLHATRSWASLVALGLALGLVLCIVQGCASSSASQQTFTSPESASDALVAALRQNDKDRLRAIFGPEGEEMIASGDDVADQNNIEKFLQAYDERHELLFSPQGDVTLEVGNSNWPFPIPIVESGGGHWQFDTAAGADEILNRRIGRNELDTIQTCLAIVDAQRDYVAMDISGEGVRQYARKFISDPGFRNGLYWPTPEGEPPSPLGPLVGEATDEGYSLTGSTTGERPSFHGYHYRLLTAQGPNAPGGARDYLSGGNLTGGFAVVAWPSTYGNSGIMAFIVNANGIVYQRDLGPNTDTIAAAMSQFDPGPEWSMVAPQP